MLSLFRPFVYLLAYMVLLFLRLHEYLPSLQGVPLLPFFMAVATLFWLVRQPKTLDAPQHRLLPLQMLLMSFSVMLTGWMSGALTVLTEFGPIVILFFLLSTSMDERRKMTFVFGMLVIFSTVMSVHGIGQLLDPAGLGWTGSRAVEGRITYAGFLNDPNDLSMALLMSLPMAMHLAGGASGILRRWFWRCLAGVIVYGVFLTSSRGALLAFGGILLAWFISRWGLWRGLMLLPVLGAGLLASAPGRLSNMSAEEDSAAGRVDAWYEGFQMLRQHPLFGVGKGLFTDHNQLTAHNSFILALAELGVVGYFVWLSGLLLSVLMLVRILRHVRGSIDPPLLDDGGGGVLGLQGGPVPPFAAQVSTARRPQGFKDEPIDLTDEAEPSHWQEIQRLARTLLYAYLAIVICAFFLSRSYVVIFYIQMALTVGLDKLARKLDADLPRVLFGDLWKPLLAVCLLSILLLYITTRLLM